MRGDWDGGGAWGWRESRVAERLKPSLQRGGRDGLGTDTALAAKWLTKIRSEAEGQSRACRSMRQDKSRHSNGEARMTPGPPRSLSVNKKRPRLLAGAWFL